MIGSRVIASAEQLIGAATLLPAPVGHARPRAEGFSAASQTIQKIQPAITEFSSTMAPANATGATATPGVSSPSAC